MEDAQGIIAKKVASPLLLAENYSGGAWKRAPHLCVIDYEFMRLMTDPTVDTLIVRMPPRHGKSWYLSRWGATWFHLMNPYDNSMLSSYSSDLAKQHGEWVRDAVHRLAPLVGLKGLSASSRSKSDWKLDETFGGMLACGLLGSQTGRGAKLILIDDYMRGVEDANSERKRDAVWEWFRGTISTRREPGCKIVILCTMWHSDDLIGRIMAQRNDIGLNIRSITLQAIREENDVKDPLGRNVGEALWPSQFSAEYLLNQRKLMGEFWFNAQYQGRPIMRIGKMFKFQSRHFITANELPKVFDEIVRFWDRAATEGGGCFSVGVLMARSGNRFYVLDVVREQLSGEQVQGLMLATALMDKLTYSNSVKTCFEREGSGSGKYVAEMTIKEFTRVGLRIEAIAPQGGKEFRSEPFAQAVASDMVSIVQSDKWTGRYIESMGLFPNGKYKDDADASAGAYKELTDPTTSKKQMTLAAKSSIGTADSYHPFGQCQCSVECKIPAFAGTYCCVECESTGGEQHGRDCMAKYNDWYIKHGPD